MKSIVRKRLFSPRILGDWDTLDFSSFGALFPVKVSFLNELFDPSGCQLPRYTEKEDSYLAEVPVPGFSSNQINVSYHGQTVRVSAEQGEKGKEDYRSFQASFLLPEKVCEDRVTAECKHGLLKIVLKKAELKKKEEPEVKKIEVKGE